MKTLLSNMLLCLLLYSTVCSAEQPVEINGKEIMEEVYRRHRQYPYVYEEQSMILSDRNGKRDTRKAHRYSRVEEDGTAKFMLIFDYPDEIEGVAVLAIRDPDGQMLKSIYLPAFAEELIETGGENSYGNFLGTDFTVENIVGEVLTEYQYRRRQDRNIKNTAYFVVDAYRLDDKVESAAPVRRHFIRQDNYFICRTDHYDNHGRVQKKQSYHDLRAVDGDMWRSGMILMVDMKEQHQSLLKVIRRMFSHDYVPAEMFTADWLYKNHPYVTPQKPLEELEVEDEVEVETETEVDISLDEARQISQLSAELEQP